LSQIGDTTLTKNNNLPEGPERKGDTPKPSSSLNDTLSPVSDEVSGSSPKRAPVQTEEEEAEFIPILGKKLSRLDEEIEALRTSPTPTQSEYRAYEETDSDDKSGSHTQNKTNPFLDGVAFMGIFSRTRDIIAANFTDMLPKGDAPSCGET